MPSPKTFHLSEFWADGYKYTPLLDSSVIPVSDMLLGVGEDSLDGSCIPVSDAALEVAVVFHSSDFGMLLQRNISLESYAIPSSTIEGALSILLDLTSISKPESDINFGIGYIKFESTATPVSDITVRYVVPNVKTVRFGDLEFQAAIRESSDKVTPIYDDALSSFGIDGPVAYTRTITIRAETDNHIEHDDLYVKLGKHDVLWVYGVPYIDCRITSLSDLQVVPGVTRWKYTIEFVQNIFTTADTASFAGFTLSHPTIPKANDINPSYSVDMSTGINITNPIPKITRHFDIECVAESSTEFNTLVSFIGARGTLVINGESYTSCYISSLSFLKPRGGGAISTYTVEFSRESGVNPVVVVYDGVILPNTIYAGAAEREIISNRTVLHSGKTAVDIGAYAAKSFSFSCMSNTKSDYSAVEAKIGQKKALSVDGDVYSKMYISSLSESRVIGDGTTRIYMWDIEFEQETL